MQIQTLPLIGGFEILEVYDFYDKPLLFSVRNKLGDLFVLSFADRYPNGEMWLASKVSDSRLKEFESGLVSIRDIFENPELASLMLFGIDDDSSVRAHVVLPPFETISAYFADPDEYVDTHSISSASADAAASQMLSEQRRAFVNLKLDKLHGPKSSINVKQLGSILSNLQDTLSNIGMNISGIDNERGRVPGLIFEETALDYAVGWNGSIGITLLSSESKKLLDKEILEKSIDVLFSLLESGSTLGYFVEYHSELNTTLTRRTLLKFKSLIASMRAADVNVSMSTSSLIGYKRTVSLSHDEIINKVTQIESYADTAERFYRIRGIVTVVNTNTGRMEITDLDTGEKYLAYVFDEDHFKENQIDVPGEYLVTLLETISVNGNTGEELNSFRVISYSPFMR